MCEAGPVPVRIRPPRKNAVLHLCIINTYLMMIFYSAHDYDAVCTTISTAERKLSYVHVHCDGTDNKIKRVKSNVPYVLSNAKCLYDTPLSPIISRDVLRGRSLVVINPNFTPQYTAVTISPDDVCFSLITKICPNMYVYV
jgi:hypothetical protein